MYAKLLIQTLFLITFVKIISSNDITDEVDNPLESFRIEGKAINQFTTDESWVKKARVVVDGGAHLGFLKSDGSFTLSGVPSGSYVVELFHPLFEFDAVRVEITSKGKIRARGLDNIQPFVVRNIVAHPLRMRCRRAINYFQQREQLQISDFIFNPMVMTMLVSLIFILLLPKLMNSQDPELQKEMQQSMNLLSQKNNIDLPEMFAKWTRRTPLTTSPKNPPSLRAKKTVKVAKLKQG